MRKWLVAGLFAIPLMGAAKKRRMLWHLSGMTEDEARETIVAKATTRFGPEKAEEIADRIVARLAAHGHLAEPAQG